MSYQFGTADKDSESRMYKEWALVSHYNMTIVDYVS